MKILNIALLSTAIAFTPAAMAQVVDQPIETTEEQAPETVQDVDAAEAEEAAPEAPASDDSSSEPMAL